MEKLRIVTLGISGGGRTRGRHATPADFALHDGTPYRDVPGAARTTLGFGICSSLKGHFCRAVPNPKLRFATFASLYGSCGVAAWAATAQLGREAGGPASAPPPGDLCREVRHEHRPSASGPDPAHPSSTEAVRAVGLGEGAPQSGEAAAAQVCCTAREGRVAHLGANGVEVARGEATSESSCEGAPQPPLSRSERICETGEC